MPQTLEDIEQYRRELTLDPTSRRFVSYAEALRRGGDLADAQAVLDQGLGHHPGLRTAMVVQARIWRDQGQKDRALSLLAELYPLDAGNVALTELYCELLIEMDHLAQAEEVLKRAQYTGLPEASRTRLEVALEQARFPADAIDDDLSSLSGVMTLPGLYLEELGDPFAVPVVAARVTKSGKRLAAKAIWREVARLHPTFSGRANREIARLDGIAGRLTPSADPAVQLSPRDPAKVAAALREWAGQLGLDVE